MSGPARRLGALTACDAVVDRLAAGLGAAASLHIAVLDTRPCPPAVDLHPPCPAYPVALIDGYAVQAIDLVGATPYTPVLPVTPPVWLRSGDRLPDTADAMLPPDLIEAAGPLMQIIGEVPPGFGVRQAGEDLPRGADLPWTGFASLCLADAGYGAVPARGRDLIAALCPRDGLVWTTARCDPSSLAGELARPGADILVVLGGTGLDTADQTVETLARTGPLIAHGLAVEPGETAAVASMADPGNDPGRGRAILAFPGRTAEIAALTVLLLAPLIARLTGLPAPPADTRRLARKIVTPPGRACVAWLRDDGERFMPLATGDVPLHLLASATHRAILPAGLEGLPDGTALAATPI
jgi:molybdopterin biosynthesis enzyme